MASLCEFSHSSSMTLMRTALPILLSRHIWVAMILAWLLVAVAAGWLWGEQARRAAYSELARQADASAALHASVLRSEMEKYRALAPAMATDPDVIAMLKTRSGDRATALNQRLEALSNQTRTSAIYTVAADGVTLAASNWNTPVSFVGADYSFRPYFIQALKSGYAEFFALGTVSRKPGLFLAHRVVDTQGVILGVTVVKVEFDALEAEWKKAGEPAFVVDPGGVVLITSEPQWRFHTLRPMDARMRQLTLADQTLGKDALTPLPFTTPDSPRTRKVSAQVDGTAQNWVHASAPTTSPGWTVHLLMPQRGQVEAGVTNARVMAALLATLVFGIAAAALRRRQRLVAQQRAAEQNRIELEHRIEERTRDLSTANQALNAEIEERIRAEASREALRHELVQASKLAALGQIAAGVAHEINQPVAAIRTQAETATAYLDQGLPAKAVTALDRISGLTSRIGAITHELLAFSRKSETQLRAIDLNEAIDGALLLLVGALRQSGVHLNRDTAEAPMVVGDRFRLEQVIVNLIQNALEALGQAADPAISLCATSTPDKVVLTITDNGTGLDPAVASQLFTPFVSSKENGLGLGLVICRDIVAGFGGELNHVPTPNGARFSITLKRATEA